MDTKAPTTRTTLVSEETTSYYSAGRCPDCRAYHGTRSCTDH